jgi:hypothetical protein
MFQYDCKTPNNVCNGLFGFVRLRWWNDFFFFFFWVFDWGFGSGHFWSGMVFWLCVFGLQGMVSVFGVALHVVIMACLASGGTERSSDDRIFELVKSDRCDIK